ncbi:hypothetical protein JZ751_002657 [Albula glossodonta]|uniref:ZP domain-containing protein n=1 Tax=Albula glossodonta TaxID=121402 RepID=A0A8T2NAE7_9TELE|nr:hypothetical protein JZ751_002657 [Albula glossodonta]
MQDGFVEYENTISNRDSLNESAPEYLKFDSTLICRYSMMNATFLKSREELHSGLLPARSNGKFQLHMDIMKDDSFLEEFHEEEYPVLRRIGEPVFVEVGIRSSDPQVEIFVKDCWGSPSADPEHPLTWSIIKDRYLS